VHNVTNPTSKPPPAGPATIHTISDIEVATGCPSKLPLLPFCASEQHGNVATTATPPVVACGAAIPLEPTPSAVYMAMDDSGSMYGAFGPKGYTTAMNLSFAFPVFKHTYIAFRFLDHLASECSGGATQYLTPAVDFGLSSAVQPQVASLLLSPAPPDTASNPAGTYLEAALGPQAVYQHLLDFAKKLDADGGAGGQLNVSAAMVFVNRRPPLPGAGDGGTGGGGDAGSGYSNIAAECNPSLSGGPAACNGDSNCQDLAQEVVSAHQKGLSTYFVVLNDQQLDPQPQLDFYDSVVAAAGGSGGGAFVLDATSTEPSVVLQKFQSGLASVATCLYDLPAGVDTTATLSVTVPPNTPVFNPTQFPAPITIAPSSSCNLANVATAEGWNIDNGRIRICGQACNNVQGVIGAVALGALSQGADGGTDGGLPVTADGGSIVVPDVPVDVTMPCSTSSGP
jgi:hypothetical protein